MDRALRFLLQIGLALACIAALTASARVIVGFMLGIHWYWAGVLAAFAGPVAFAAALFLFDRGGRRSDA
jgi:hypothetical protein